MLREAVHNRWFALTDLALTAISIVLWELFPELGWRPLILVLIPWLLRLTVRSRPFKRTGTGFLLAIFLTTAAVGIWAAYDQQTAWSKFWLLVGAVLLFYALANQPPENIWIIAGFFAVVGFGIAVFFLLTQDWMIYPAKIDLLNRIGLLWQKSRLTLPYSGIHPNDAAGVMAMMSFFIFASTLRAWEKKRWYLVGVLIGISLLVFFAFTLTTSRGAWFAFYVVAAVSVLWLFSTRLSRLIDISAGIAFSIALVLVIVLCVVVIKDYPGGTGDVGDVISNPVSMVGRLDLFTGTLDLIADYPITGAGLGAFPGLYSRYILTVPFLIQRSSHNVFLDIGLEQGILGLLVYLGIIGSIVIRFFRGVKTEPEPYLRWAVLSGIAVMVLHGMVDNIIYFITGVPLLFLLPGFASALISLKDGEGETLKSDRQRNQALKYGLPITVMVMIVFLAIFRDSLLSTWYSNQASVQMSQAELADFPAGHWDDGGQGNALYPARILFTQSLELNPNNRTASYRLGLIAMLGRDFPTAVAYLENAHHLDPSHQGIRKMLGYSYVWADQPELAFPLLVKVPEAKDEMEVYVWWWETQGRMDLAVRAEQMVLDIKFMEGQ